MRGRRAERARSWVELCRPGREDELAEVLAATPVPRKLADALEAAPLVAERAIDRFGRWGPARRPIEMLDSQGRPATLSPSLVDVLRCRALGLTNPETAAALGVGEETVKTQSRRILARLHARNMLQAVLLASKQDVI